ncbi:hypothetical protein L218DRAFT_964192 [Marasmius fiardii PR-910]|nr:hypothetical protein L218DRAFT_964192 [Marasmius fiardii PR-910]
MSWAKTSKFSDWAGSMVGLQEALYVLTDPKGIQISGFRSHGTLIWVVCYSEKWILESLDRNWFGIVLFTAGNNHLHDIQPVYNASQTRQILAVYLTRIQHVVNISIFNDG